eukprot:scaffold7623_cov123-Cylindrotheca_fusiformis.AAC.2
MSMEGDDEEVGGESTFPISTSSNGFRKTDNSQLVSHERSSNTRNPLSTPLHQPKIQGNSQSTEMQPSLGTGSRSRTFRDSLKSTDHIFSKPMRRRSSLFESLPSRSQTRNELSISSLLERTSPPTVLDESFQSTLPVSRGDAPTQGKKKKSSLFGAVMKRFGGTEQLQMANPTPATPMKDSRPRNYRGNDSIRDVTSPSGKSIVNVLRDFVNSPFRFKSPKSKQRVVGKAEPRSESHSSPSPHQKRRRLNLSNDDSQSSWKENDSWQEVPFDAKQVRIIDYTLRTKLSIECNKESSLRSVVSRESFLSLLSYWQYPTVPIASSSPSVDEAGVVEPGKNNLEGGKGSKSRPNESERGLPNTTKRCLAEKLDRLVRGESSVMSRAHVYDCSLAKSGRSSIGSRREWQEAFRSVYLNWCRKGEALMNKEVSQDTVFDTYFYCVANDHIVLFRFDERSQGQCTAYCAPRVIVSSATHFFREKLESMGVEAIESLDEASREEAHRTSQATGQNRSPMSPSVKADLEALRRAQTNGENAGADVFVKLAKRNHMKSSIDYDRIAISVTGPDNVSLFFEVYLNLFGCIAPPGMKCESLPTIYCRNVGPFLHASMKSLNIRPIKSSDTDSAEVEGMILPCSLREAVGHITTDLVKRVGRSDDGASGYMVIQAATEKATSQSARTLRDSTSINGWGVNEEQAAVLPEECYQCGYGKAVKLIVWDTSCNSIVACNIE